jgi:hypothetical protein
VRGGVLFEVTLAYLSDRGYAFALGKARIRVWATIRGTLV